MPRSPEVHFYKDGVPLPPSPTLRLYERAEEEEEEEEEERKGEWGGDKAEENGGGEGEGEDDEDDVVQAEDNGGENTSLDMASFVDDAQSKMGSNASTPVVKGSLVTSSSAMPLPKTPTIKINAGIGGIFGATPTVLATFESPRWLPAGETKAGDDGGDGNGRSSAKIVLGTATPVVTADIMRNEEKGQVQEVTSQKVIESPSWQERRERNSPNDCGQVAVSLQSLLAVRDVLATTELFWMPSAAQPISGPDSYVKEIRQYDRSFRERLFEDAAVGELFETSVRGILGMEEEERPPLVSLERGREGSEGEEGGGGRGWEGREGKGMGCKGMGGDESEGGRR